MLLCLACCPGAQAQTGMRRFVVLGIVAGIAVCWGMLWLGAHPQSHLCADPDNDSSSTGASGLSVSAMALSPDTNTSTVLASPITGLLPELTPDALQSGVCLFLLQVSGAAAISGNANLNWALSVNLATRLTYVTADNLYLLNYTQIPASSRRRLLSGSPVPSPSPANIGEIQAGVVALPDLEQEVTNISVQGTGVQIRGPSMTFMYEVDVTDNAYIQYIHNQLNSIIATSVLLKDVQAANLSVSSIYLLSFEPAQSTASADITAVQSSVSGKLALYQQWKAVVSSLEHECELAASCRVCAACIQSAHSTTCHLPCPS